MSGETGGSGARSTEQTAPTTDTQGFAVAASPPATSGRHRRVDF
jgi:hypothetical protein